MKIREESPLVVGKKRNLNKFIPTAAVEGGEVGDSRGNLVADMSVNLDTDEDADDRKEDGRPRFATWLFMQWPWY